MTDEQREQVFTIFRKENPLEFDEEQFEKVRKDLFSPREGIASDEYVDFILWIKGYRSRQEAFADYVEELLPLGQYPKLLEVGAGKKARLSKILHEKGYSMEAMDPELLRMAEVNDGIRCRKEPFIYGKTDVTAFDAVIAEEPCEATEPMIRACVEAKKDFVISLCGTPHLLMNGEMPEDIYAWHQYLCSIAPKNCSLRKPKLIPGYLTYVIVGRFS